MRFLRLKAHFPEMRFRAGKAASRRGRRHLSDVASGATPYGRRQVGPREEGPVWPGFFFLTLGHPPGRGRRTPRRRLPAIPATAGVVRPTQMTRGGRRIHRWSPLPATIIGEGATRPAAERGFGLRRTRGSGGEHGRARQREAHRALGSVLEEVEWREKRGIGGIEQSPRRRWLSHCRGWGAPRQGGELRVVGEGC